MHRISTAQLLRCKWQFLRIAQIIPFIQAEKLIRESHLPIVDITGKPLYIVSRMKLMPKQQTQRILILYHFYKPDDVISARHFSDLAEGLAKRDWDVTVLTSNRYCRAKNDEITPKCETINGVKVIRMSRPPFDQGKNISRMINSAWISSKWLIKILFSKRYDIILMGTDPQLGYFILPWIKLFKPKTKTALWAFDLYPEIITKIDPLPLAIKVFNKAISPLVNLSYKSMDFIADLGSCMRQRIMAHDTKAAFATLIPWAISEPGKIIPPNKEIRHKLFGKSKLTILYSGTIGQAHTFIEFIQLARELRTRKADISICFAGRGNRYKQLREMVTPDDTNISFAGFADEKELPLRLTAADMHLISLKEGWEGLVVPSKFFGSIAAGRPLIYAGTPNSVIKKWIEKHKIGFYLDSSNIKTVADSIIKLSKDPAALNSLQKQTFKTWQDNFSQESILDKFDLELGKLIGIYSEIPEVDYVKQKLSEIARYKVDNEFQKLRLEQNSDSSKQELEEITER